MKSSFWLTVLSLLLFSCSPKNTEDEQEKITRPKENQHQLEKTKIIDSLVQKYNIAYNWDTLHYIYSNNYKPVIKSGYQLIDDFFISDICEKDGAEYFSIITSLFYFDFPITKEQENILIQIKNDLVLVVNIAELKKIKLALKGEVEDSESATVDFGIPINFIGKGSIIDIVSLKND